MTNTMESDERWNEVQTEASLMAVLTVWQTLIGLTDDGLVSCWTQPTASLILSTVTATRDEEKLTPQSSSTLQQYTTSS